MRILGISAFYHDSAAAIIEDGRVLFAVQEERFSRIKNDASFPEGAIRFCLQESRTNIDELEAIVFYDKPFLKFERILESYYSTAPSGLPSFLRSMPIWINQKLNIKGIIKKGLKVIAGRKVKLPPIYFPEHHLSHAASAYYPAPFDEALIITVDGVGEFTTTSICHGKGNIIKRLKTIHFPDSLGLLYAAATYYLGFKINSGEYKVMGLASYGEQNSEEVNGYYHKIVKHLIDIKDDGSFKLNQSYFRYMTGLRMTRDRKWEDLFGFKRRSPGDPILARHKNFACAIQAVTEFVLTNIVKEGIKLTGSKKLCMAGGVALNCVANGNLIKANLFDEMYVQPAAGDAGGAVGAALAYYYLVHQDEPRKQVMPDMYLGPVAENKDLDTELEKTVYTDFNKLCDDVAEFLIQGKTIGWVQDRMEFGPRALGNRSILADPRFDWMKDHVNELIKNREGFRPFAPVVLEEDAASYFDMDAQKPSPHMLATYEVRSKEVPAVTHVDNSARVQTVNQKQNEKLYKLIQTFKEKTGCSVLLNTSFNDKDEPIVATGKDAMACFQNTNLDYLVIDQMLYSK